MIGHAHAMSLSTRVSIVSLEMPACRVLMGAHEAERCELKKKVEINGEPCPLLLGLHEAMRNAQG